jgi:hypothetical protein
MQKKLVFIRRAIRDMADSACPYIVIYGYVKKTQMLKGERVGRSCTGKQCESNS